MTDSYYYNNGELITKDRIEDEPWYADFQAVAKIKIAGPNRDAYYSFFERVENGKQLALEKCKEYFEEFPGPEWWTPPSDERLMRWIEAMWQPEEVVKHLESLYLEEMKVKGLL